MKPYEQLRDIANRNIGDMVTCKGTERELFLNDLIEAFQDIVILQSEFGVVFRTESSSKEVWQSLIAIFTRAWHTIDHLNALQPILDNQLESPDD